MTCADLGDVETLVVSRHIPPHPHTLLYLRAL